MNLYVSIVFIGTICIVCTRGTVIIPVENTQSPVSVAAVTTSASVQKGQGDILGIVGSHDVVNLAVADNAQQGSSNNEMKANEVAAKTTQMLDAQEGYNERIAIASPKTKTGNSFDISVEEKLRSDKADEVPSDTHSPASDVVVATAINGIESQDSGVYKNKADNQTTGCNVKNSTCVPTRKELVAAGVENIDLLQHRVSGPKLNLEPLKDKALKANENKPEKSIGCNVKNKTCVPTREELVAAGVENVDLLQHRIDGQAFDLSVTLKSERAERTENSTGCNVKNSTCVPSEETLIAAGTENVDLVQHRVSGPKLNLEPLKDKALKANENKPEKSAGCDVKNKTCVPTREELVATGVPNVDLLQHRVDGPTLNLQSLKDKVLKAKENKPELSDGCNVKNKTCVHTKEELVAAGVSNVDVIQHEMTGPKELVLNEPLRDKVKDTNVTGAEKKTGCDVKNSTCVPTEKELIAAGINTQEFVGQYSLDSENIFLGQLKQNEPNTIEAAIPSDAADISDSNASLQKEKMSENSSTSEVTTDKITKAIKPSTVPQVPAPVPTTQQTKSTAETAGTVENLSTTGDVESKLESPTQQTLEENKASPTGTTLRLTTSAVESKVMGSPEQTTSMTTEFQPCPKITCPEACRYGRKVNSDGCETCECKFSDDCPSVLPASRLLCLLQVRSGQGCASNADCRRNRICCPGTCGPTCRRASRSRSMLLSMLVD